jgi:hypothetical protein
MKVALKCSTAVAMSILIAASPVGAKDQVLPMTESGAVDFYDRGCISDQWTENAAAFVQSVLGVSPLPICVRRARAADLQSLFAAVALHDGSVAAAYVPGRREVLVSDDLDFEKPLDRSFLVHEFVHAVQFSKNRKETVACLGRLESEAYEIQARFLKQQGYSTEALLFRLSGLMQGSCEAPY